MGQHGGVVVLDYHDTPTRHFSNAVFKESIIFTMVCKAKGHAQPLIYMLTGGQSDTISGNTVIKVNLQSA